MGQPPPCKTKDLEWGGVSALRLRFRPSFGEPNCLLQWGTEPQSFAKGLIFQSESVTEPTVEAGPCGRNTTSRGLWQITEGMP